MCRALFGCSENVREKRRIGRGVVVDLRFLRVEEDGKSRVFFFFVKFPFVFSASKQRVKTSLYLFCNLYFLLGLSCLRFLEH